MSCLNCNQNLLDGLFYCDINDYRVIDNLTDKNLIFVIETHDIEEGNEEIGINDNIKYCNSNNCKYIFFQEDSV